MGRRVEGSWDCSDDVRGPAAQRPAPTFHPAHRQGSAGTQLRCCISQPQLTTTEWRCTSWPQFTTTNWCCHQWCGVLRCRCAGQSCALLAQPHPLRPGRTMCASCWKMVPSSTMVDSTWCSACCRLVRYWSCGAASTICCCGCDSSGVLQRAGERRGLVAWGTGRPAAAPAKRGACRPRRAYPSQDWREGESAAPAPLRRRTEGALVSGSSEVGTYCSDAPLGPASSPPCSPPCDAGGRRVGGIGRLPRSCCAAMQQSMALQCTPA